MTSLHLSDNCITSYSLHHTPYIFLLTSFSLHLSPHLTSVLHITTCISQIHLTDKKPLSSARLTGNHGYITSTKQHPLSMQEPRNARMQTTKVLRLLSLLGETLTPHNGEKCWKKSSQVWPQKIHPSLDPKKELVSLHGSTLSDLK